MEQSSPKCLEDPAIAVQNKLSATSNNHSLNSSRTENVLEPITFESKNIQKSKTFLFVKSKDENTLHGETEIKNAFVVVEKLETQPEEQDDQIISTSELLDPEAPTDQLSSSKSTPENLSNVLGELAEAKISQQPSLRKILSSKRSSSVTRFADTGNVTTVTGTATPARPNLARRKLSERRGFFDMAANGGVIRDALLSATLPTRRCRLFPFGMDLHDATNQVSASRSVDGEWSISDHPNYKVLPTGPLFAQESAFPAFYDKIEIPVPLPPWDDPGFSLECELPPPPLHPQQRPAQALPAPRPRSELQSEPTSRAPSRCSTDASDKDEN